MIFMFSLAGFGFLGNGRIMNEIHELHKYGATKDRSRSKTLSSTAYYRLRSDIISGVLAPNEKLRAEHLKERYEVGAATLREALALLVADALVVSEQQRGFWVAPMSITDFRDITETRAILESHALRGSILNGDDEWEAQLSAAFHKLSKAEERKSKDAESVEYWESCNRTFHEVLVSRCDSRWTIHFLGILYRQSERYRRFAVLNAPPERDVHAEHVSIFEACLARDAEAACRHIESHIRQTLDVVIHINQGLEA